MENLDQLEAELTVLGRIELTLENTLRELKTAARQAVAAGRDGQANELWLQVDRVMDQLKTHGLMVRALEARLYGARRRARP